MNAECKHVFVSNLLRLTDFPERWKQITSEIACCLALSCALCGCYPFKTHILKEDTENTLHRSVFLTSAEADVAQDAPGTQKSVSTLLHSKECQCVCVFTGFWMKGIVLSTVWWKWRKEEHEAINKVRHN